MSSTYGWVIDRDALAEIDNEDGLLSSRAGVVGPRGITDEMKQDLYLGMGQRFRMLDDDGILCYEGRIKGDYDGFEPLDDFGTPDAGCTGIQYLEEGLWVAI